MITTTKKLAFALLTSVGALLAFASDGRARPPDQFEILTGFSSKESCSCAFIVEQSDAYCEEFGKLDGYPVQVVIDRNAKTVTSTFASVSRVARFTEEKGCVTDALP